MSKTTSLYLDIVRIIAALIVMLSHISLLGQKGFGFMSGAGIQAVDVFFVLSGFVIAYVADGRERDFKTYSVSRMARIYSVALPALLLTIVFDAIGKHFDPAVYAGNTYQPITAGLLIRSVLFIGQQWTALRSPGSDSPYWSLGFEVWYYIAFAAFLFSPRRWRWIATLCVLVFIGPKVAVMMPVWLLGVGIYHLTKHVSLPMPAGWVLTILPIIAFAIFEAAPHAAIQAFMPFDFSRERLASTAQDYFIGGLFGLHLTGFITIARSFPRLLDRAAAPIRWLAGGTFSLYLTHMPILCLLCALAPWPDSSLYLILSTLAISYGFAEVSERRKLFWRQSIRYAVDRLHIWPKESQIGQ